MKHKTSAGRFGLALSLAFANLMLIAPHASAVKLDPHYYVVGNRMTAWYSPILKAPKNWVVNEEWSERYERLVLFENGDMSPAKPLIYVRAHVADEQPLDQYIQSAQTSWLSKLKNSTIDVLPDVTRPGKPVIKMYLYKNPSQPDQAFELTAFMKDASNQKPPSTVFLQAVMAAPSMAELDRARPAFMELLDSLD